MEIFNTKFIDKKTIKMISKKIKKNVKKNFYIFHKFFID